MKYSDLKNLSAPEQRAALAHEVGHVLHGSPSAVFAEAVVEDPEAAAQAIRDAYTLEYL